MAKDPYEGLSGPELLFRRELDQLGARVDAVLFKPVRVWMPVYYCYRIIRADGSTAQGIMEWNTATYAEVVKIAGEN